MAMKKSYDFSKAIKNPYAKRLQSQASTSPITKKQEGNRIAIGMSCANCSGIDSAKIYEFITKQARGYEGYARRPQSGSHAAGLDFYLVLESTASIASIAGFLWMAYARLIAPKKRGPKDDAGIYIEIRGPQRAFVKVWLGKDVHTQGEFAKQFELMVEKAQDEKWQIAHTEKIEEIQNRGPWVKMSESKKPKIHRALKRPTRGREYQR
jgi:hypothetical protein